MKELLASEVLEVAKAADTMPISVLRFATGLPMKGRVRDRIARVFQERAIYIPAPHSAGVGA